MSGDQLDLDAIEARANAATDGGFGWRLTDNAGSNEVWADRDAAGHDALMVATTATRLNPHPGVKGYSDAAHIAGMSPTVTLALVAEVRRLRAQVGRVESASADMRERGWRYEADKIDRALNP